MAAKDGTVQFFIDKCKLNAVTKSDTYSILRMDECLDSLGIAQSFTSMVANCAYCQVLMDEKSKWSTKFDTNKRHFRFKRIPVGLMSVPATFQ